MDIFSKFSDFFNTVLSIIAISEFYPVLRCSKNLKISEFF